MDERFEPAMRTGRHAGVLESPSLSALLPPVPEWPDLN
jgi:hypothetical protein